MSRAGERLRSGAASLVVILLAACGGGGGGSDGGSGSPGGGTGGGGGGTGGGGGGGAVPQSFTVGGTVSGLAGTGLVLQVNGGDDLSLTSSGSFNFATTMAGGATYTVAIRTQPANPTQICTLNNASGTIGNSNVTNVSVTCANAYSVGGTVSGVSVDAGLVLQNGAEELAISHNGSFAFAANVASGAAYNVTVRTQPTAPVQNCTVSSGTGTVGAAGIADVLVSCDGIALLAGALGGPGYLDGVGGAARFNRPVDVGVDAAGNMFVSDGESHTIRKITATGVVSTLAGAAGQSGSINGTGSDARFNGPAGLATDAAGNVYVVDSNSHTIRKITPAGVVSTLAGVAGQDGDANGSGSNARFRAPHDVAVDLSGNLYVADAANHTIRRITPAGVVSTLAGTAQASGFTNGTGAAARFNTPRGVTTDAAGNVYVADTVNHAIRKITPAGVVSTLAGTGQPGAGDGSTAQFRSPERLGIDSAGNLLVADTGNHTIRTITPAGVTGTLAGSAGRSGIADGRGDAARFNSPRGAAVDSAGNIYVTDNNNHTIRKITPTAEVSTVAGTPLQEGYADGTGTAARFFESFGIDADAAGNVYLVDASRHTIRKITPAGVVSTIAGAPRQRGDIDGTGPEARFDFPLDVAVDSAGNAYVADFDNYTIRKITRDGVVTTLAGLAGESGTVDGTGSSARFDAPYGIAADSSGTVYVADQFGTIRKITPAGVVSTLAGAAGEPGDANGNGSSARFRNPQGIDVDSAGNLYVADTYNHTIRRITPGGIVSTLAGMPEEHGFVNDVGSAARFNYPNDVAVDAAGNVYVTDQSNRAIRRVTPDGTVTTVAGAASSRGVLLGPLPGSLGEPRGIALLPGPRVTLVMTDAEKGILLLTLL